MKINGDNDLFVNNNAIINKTLFLQEGAAHGLKWKQPTFGKGDSDVAELFLTSEQDSQQTFVIKMGNEANDKIALIVPDINGVTQNGFKNLHEGNLHIVFDTSPQLGGNLDVLGKNIDRNQNRAILSHFATILQTSCELRRH